MKNVITRISIFFLILMTFTSCEVIEGIFKLGMGVGIFMVIAIIAVIIFIITKLNKK